MRILAIETTVENVSSTRFTREIAAAEARRAWDLHQAGTIREFYFRADSPAAVLVLECVDVAEAQTALTSLPMVAAGLISFEAVPLRGPTPSSRGSSGLPSRRDAGQHAAGTRDVARHPAGQLAAEVVGQLAACATALE